MLIGENVWIQSKNWFLCNWEWSNPSMKLIGLRHEGKSVMQGVGKKEMATKGKEEGEKKRLQLSIHNESRLGPASVERGKATVGAGTVSCQRKQFPLCQRQSWEQNAPLLKGSIPHLYSLEVMYRCPKVMGWLHFHVLRPQEKIKGCLTLRLLSL